MAEAVIVIDPVVPNAKEANQNWISQSILPVVSFTPTSLEIYINSFGSRDFDMEIYIEETASGSPPFPFSDQTGHILYSGTIPKADLNAHIDEFFQFTVALTGTVKLYTGNFYHIVTWAQDPVFGYRFRVSGEATGPASVQLSSATGNDPTVRNWVADANNKDIAIELWGTNIVGAIADTPGNLRVKGERLLYGDGESYERYFEGNDSGETGTAGEVGYESGGTVLRYTSDSGKIREVSLQDTGLDLTAGQLGYESAGRRLRFVDAGGKKREAEGMLS